MLLNSLVKIPDVPGKIVIGRGTYVMYEIDRKYNPEKKYNIPVRVTIGIVSPKQDGYMIPNEKFSLYFPDVELPEPSSYRSSCLKIGSYIVIDKILNSYKLHDLIDDIFGSDAGLFKDFAAYSIITESNVAQYYSDYAFNHPLFTNNFKIYSDSKLSEFFNSVTVDQRLEFLDKWNSGREHYKTVYLSYDSTNKNVQAGEIEIAEFGHAKDDKSKPIVNISIGYDHNNREPLFYEEYPGSIVDIEQLNYTINKAEGYGYKNIGFILDRGYFSKANLKRLDEKKMPFIIMAKGSTNLVKDFIKEQQGTFELATSNRVSKYCLYAKTIKRKMFEKDKSERYIHIYYSDIGAAIDRENFEIKIERLESNLRKFLGTKLDTTEFEKYYSFEKNDFGVIAKIKPKNSVIDAEKKTFGYFVIITSRNMSAKEAIKLYKSRDESEKLFRADKSYLGNSAMRVQSEESLRAKTLVEFVALIVRNRIYTCLDEALDNMDERPNYMTVPAAIKELEKIEMIKQMDGKYRLDHALTKAQKTILKAFKIDAKTIVEEANKISEILMKNNA